MGKLYKVIKYREDGSNRTMYRNMTLDKAQDICNDPETSSMTAKQPRGCDGSDLAIARWHDKQKHWFYGYTEQ